MIDNLRVLRGLRKDVGLFKAEMAELEEKLAATPAGQALAEKRKICGALKEDIYVVETEIKEAAIKAYIDTGKKRPWPGVNIKMFSELLYSGKEVENWCREFAPCLLTVNWYIYKKAHATLPGAPGTSQEQPRAQIDRDLSKAADRWGDVLE